MPIAREQARASLEIIRVQVGQLSAPSPDELQAPQAADSVLMAVGLGEMTRSFNVQHSTISRLAA